MNMLAVPSVCGLESLVSVSAGVSLERSFIFKMAHLNVDPSSKER